MKKRDSKHMQWGKHNKYQQASCLDGEKQLEPSARWAGSLAGVEVALSKRRKKRSFDAIAHANAEFSRFAHDDAAFTA